MHATDRQKKCTQYNCNGTILTGFFGNGDTYEYCDKCRWNDADDN